MVIIHGPAHAAKKNILALGATTQEINISPYSYITEDELGELSAQDIVQRFRNNIRGTRNNDGKLRLSVRTQPYWIAFGVWNNSKNRDWVLDFGGLTDGRSGMAVKLLVYEGVSRKIYFDGLSQTPDQNQTSMIETGVPLSLKTGEQSIVVLYVVPDDGTPLTLPLSLSPLKSHVSDLNMGSEQLFIHLVSIALIVSAALMFMGYVYTQSIGFLPFTAYYLLTSLWFLYVESQVFSDIFGVDILSSVFIMIQAVLIASGCFLTVPQRSNLSNLRLVTIFTIAMTLMALIALLVAVPFGSPIRHWGALCISAVAVVVSIFFLLLNKTPYTKTPSYYVCAWIGLLIFAHALRTLSIAEIIPYHWIFIQAHYLTAFPQMILVFIGVIFALENDNKRHIANVVKKAQKAQTLLKAKQSKEASDQSRLLRVIEREREIMEELRGREAERTDEMRKAKVAADDANNSKSAFLAVVSHEIRTPMTGVMGMLRLLEDTDLTKEQQDYAMTIKDSGDAMLALLNDILDFSKIESGGMDIESIEFDLHRVLNGVQMLMKGHADQKQIGLVLDIDPDLPNTLIGDPTRIRQIFLNLVGNALKFTSQGTVKMTVNIDKNHNAYDPGNGRYAIYFAVEDTGIGISEDAQRKLFSPFAQADSSIARKYGGTGLGLAICKKLVEAMGATIQISSEEGKGTTFYFTLAIQSSDKNLKDDKNDQPSLKITPMKFLVVDDNAINCKVVSGLLSRDGHSFEIARTGQETLDTIKKDPNFDAVLLDIELPDMNGTEVTSILKADENTMGIRIIALTGNIQDDDIETYKDAGMIDFIPKPIDPDHLRQVIARLGNKEAVSISEYIPQPNTDHHDDDSFSGAIEAIETKETAPKTTTTVLLDEDMLKGLKDGLGGPQTKELVEGVFEKTAEILPLMQTAYEKNDKDTLRARAHELKGMAGNFGLSGLSEKAAMIERLCRDEASAIDDTKEYIELLDSTTERSRAAIDKFLDV